MSLSSKSHLYSIIIAIHSANDNQGKTTASEGDEGDWRLGDITVDWVDFTREKNVDQFEDTPAKSRMKASTEIKSTESPSSRRGVQGSSSHKKLSGTPQRVVPGSQARQSSPSHPSQQTSTNHSNKKKTPSDPDSLSLQPLLGHFPGPNPLETSVAKGVSAVGRGVVHLFRHAPPAHLIASLEAHPIGEGSGSNRSSFDGGSGSYGDKGDDWAGERAEGEDGSLIAILAVPAWMRPADFLEFIGGWGTCLEGVRMIREATTPNRSIVLLKFRDPLQASDFLVIFTGRAFSSLDNRETCHPIRIHHLVLHKLDDSTTSSGSSAPIPIPAFPPSVYSSRVQDLPQLLKDIPASSRYELPSCPVCLERLDSTVTGLVTLPCAHTFDCDCLQKWGDSRCPVCRVSHLLLSSSSSSSSSSANPSNGTGHAGGTGSHRSEITRLTKCSMCDSTEHNWICVVCGTVGCGRYEPGKGHARRHWEESGHVLAMELETQRVWDYKGDNYVHRLIQTRNDGKLVELPSASSLVTPSHRPLPLNPHHLEAHGPPSPHANRPNGAALSPHHANGSSTVGGLSSTHDTAVAGPSSNDIDKISTIESITLEYSYLLSSQLEAMRQHYESKTDNLISRIESLEARLSDSVRQESMTKDAEKARDKAEKKATQAVELSRNLQTALNAERAMSSGLSERIKLLESQSAKMAEEQKEREEEKRGLEETVRDLMFALDAGQKIAELGGEGGEGGDVVLPTPTPTTNAKGRKAGKGKR